MSTSGLIGNSQGINNASIRYDSITVPMFIEGPRTTQLLIGERKLHAHLGEILELRRRCGQADDLTTDPEYFLAANSWKRAPTSSSSPRSIPSSPSK
jgi:hypothetical protein